MKTKLLFQELFKSDVPEKVVDFLKDVLGSKDSLNSAEVGKLLPLIQHGAPLLEFLNSPLAELIGTTLPFVKIGTALLKFYLEKNEKEPTLVESVIIVAQAAYLEGFKDLVSQHSNVQQWLKSRNQVTSEVVSLKMQALAELELTDKEARRSLVYFAETSLAKALNEVMAARLESLGATSEATTKICHYVTQRAQQHIIPSLAESNIQRLIDWHHLGREVFEQYLSIDSYLEEVIKPEPEKPVFAEPFSVQDIYIPVKAMPLNRSNQQLLSPIELERLVKEWLNDDTKNDRVLFIQGEPGRGKSVFCRMFAD